MKAMKLQDDIPSIRIDKLKDHHAQVFELNSMQDATEKCHYPELVGEPETGAESYFLSLEHVTEVIVLGERLSSASVETFSVCGKKI